MDLGLADRVFVLTGASRGLGFATARGPGGRRRQGGHLLARRRTGSTRRSPRWAARGSGRAGRRPGRPGDAARPGRTAQERFGRLDGALLSVGGPARGTAAEMTDDQWRAAFETVFLGTVRAARTFAAALPAGGAIALVLSTSARSADRRPGPVQRPAARPGRGRQGHGRRVRPARRPRGQPAAGPVHDRPQPRNYSTPPTTRRRPRPRRPRRSRCGRHRRAGGVRPGGGVRAVPGRELCDRRQRSRCDGGALIARPVTPMPTPSRGRPGRGAVATRDHPRRGRPRPAGAVLRHQPGPVLGRHRPPLRPAGQPLLAGPAPLRLHRRAAAPGRAVSCCWPLGLGITNVVDRASARADELTPAELVAGGAAAGRAGGPLAAALSGGAGRDRLPQPRSRRPKATWAPRTRRRRGTASGSCPTRAA